MRTLAITAVVAALAATVAPASADEPLVGIVSISATEANNARYISGAAGRRQGDRLERLGDRRRRQRRPGERGDSELRPARSDRDRRHGLPLFLDRRRARRRQERQNSGRDLGRRTGRRRRRHERIGRPHGHPGQRSHDQDNGRQGVGARADLSHRRSVPEPRGRARQGARGASRHQGHQERSPHSRLFRGWRPIRQRLARLASAWQGEPRHLGMLGRSGDWRDRLAAARKIATT